MDHLCCLPWAVLAAAAGTAPSLPGLSLRVRLVAQSTPAAEPLCCQGPLLHQEVDNKRWVQGLGEPQTLLQVSHFAFKFLVVMALGTLLLCWQLPGCGLSGS